MRDGDAELLIAERDAEFHRWMDEGSPDPELFSRVGDLQFRLKQPKLPEGTWEVTVWDEPSFFEWRQKSSGVTSVAGHRVDVLDETRSRLTLSLDMRGLVISITGRLFKDLTNRYMTLEAEGMKRAAESTGT